MSVKWQVAPDVLSSKIDEEVVLMSIETGYYFVLDKVGSTIWEHLAKNSATLEELVTKLVGEYDIDQETCSSDVKIFIDELISRTLVVKVQD